MKIILLEQIKNLGKKGSVVDVKPGYARNFLFPKEKAILGSRENIKHFEIEKNKFSENLKKEILIAESRIEKLKKIGKIKIFSKSGLNGKLFGSIGVKEIFKSINKLGFFIKKNEIKLINGKIRKLGEYEVIFKPHYKLLSRIKILVE
ncbi:50S ribosomal protein L9 [Buchnera aphidicola (Tetraneura ulmi)]|uniref:50S ribosomal protein L9 n=1 Tax=Buchnera aphidicola TaxID=9 RepID=UPI003463E0E6